MRWSLRLSSPSLTADVENELALGPDEQGRSARVTVSPGREFVEFAVVAEGISQPVPPPAYPEWHNRSHLAVLLNPGHDHATRWLYAVDDAGAVIRQAEWALPGEEPGDNLTRPLDEPPEAQGRFEPLGQERFRACLRIPTGAVWPEEATPAGVAIKVGFHEECIPAPLRWPPLTWAADAPLAFGDLYPRTPPLRVDEIEIPEPTWGGEPTWITIRATAAADAPASGRIHVQTILPGDSEQQQGAVSWQAAGRRLEVRTPVVFPHRGKWANDCRAIARLRLTFVDDAGRTIWSAQYPFGFDAGIIVRERFGPAGRPLPPRPEPTDPDFVDKFRQYVLSRLPDYRPKTTRQGAPSDFCLEDAAAGADSSSDPGALDGSRPTPAELDLCEDDWPERVAAMLAERFGRWDDALCAAAMWVYHPHVTRHSSSWSRLSGQATVRTLPRLGGCFCGDTARLTAMLAEKVGRQLGVPLRGYSIGLRGHLATLVDSPGGRVVIDGMMGLWFHTLDNTRLATLEEMRTCRRIVERMWYRPRAHGHEFFFGVSDQMIRRWEEGSLAWPNVSDPIEAAVPGTVETAQEPKGGSPRR